MIILKKNPLLKLGQRAKHVALNLDWPARGSFFWAVVITLICATQGCRSVDVSPPPEPAQMGPFAIYLMPTEYLFEGIVVDDCTNLGSALLVEADIAAYSWSRHDIVLQPGVGERLTALDITGKPFVTCVGEDEIYRGEIMAAYMSRSSDEVVILWPPFDGDTSHFGIQLGYPGADFFVGSDRRADERIKTALIAAGVLKD